MSPPSIIFTGRPSSASFQRGNVSAVAVRPGAVDHKRVSAGQAAIRLGGDLAVRDAACLAGDVWRGFLAADYVQQDEVDLAGTLGAVHIGAVGLKMQLWLNHG